MNTRYRQPLSRARRSDANIREVATRAKVSIATVSRVLTQSSLVSPRLENVVRRAMADLAYAYPRHRHTKCDGTASTRQGPNFVFLVTNPTAKETLQLLHGASLTATEMKINLFFCRLTSSLVLPSVFTQKISAVLLHGPTPPSIFHKPLERIPSVWLTDDTTTPSWGDRIVPDHYSLGERAAIHLVSRGHRSLAIISPPDTRWPSNLYTRSFLSTAAGLGFPVSLIQPKSTTTDFPSAAVSEYLHLSPRPTGIFLPTDEHLHLIHTLLQNHKTAAEIAACTRSLNLPATLTPPATLFALSPRALAQRAIQHLAWRLQNPHIAGQLTYAIEAQIHLA